MPATSAGSSEEWRAELRLARTHGRIIRLLPSPLWLGAVGRVRDSHHRVSLETAGLEGENALRANRPAVTPEELDHSDVAHRGWRRRTIYRPVGA
jgi:hypothetical protein